LTEYLLALNSISEKNMFPFDSTAFSAAWNAHELDTIMAMSSDDCEFHSSAGSDPRGTVYVGPDAVRAAYANLFAAFPDAQWSDSRSTLIGESRVLTEWRFIATKPDGTKLKVDGLDVLELSNGKVKIKNSYRKSIL
jgi:hypothetical protein